MKSGVQSYEPCCALAFDLSKKVGGRTKSTLHDKSCSYVSGNFVYTAKT